MEVYFDVSASVYFERKVDASVEVDHTGLIVGTTKHVEELDVSEPTTAMACGASHESECCR